MPELQDPHFNFIDPRNYQKESFTLRFKKRRTEKAFLLDSSIQSRPLLSFLIPTMLFLILHSFPQDPELLLEFQGFSINDILSYLSMGGTLLAMKRTKKPTLLSIYLIKGLLFLIGFLIKWKIMSGYEYKPAYISLIFWDFFVNLMTNMSFHINFFLNFLENVVLYFHFQWPALNFLKIWLLSMISSYILDRNSRENWAILDQNRKGYKTFLNQFMDCINPHFIIDQNKRILAMNQRAQEIYDFSLGFGNEGSKDKGFFVRKVLNTTAKANIMKLIRNDAQQCFEDELRNAREFSASAFSLDLLLPKRYSGLEDMATRYAEADLHLLEEILGKDSLFDEFSEENGIFGDVKATSLIKGSKVNTNERLTDKDNEELNMMFSANIRPIIWANRPSFTLEFKNSQNEKEILLKTINIYNQIRESLFEILSCIENDYIKWNNLQSNAQGALLIKDGDLKNLANCIYLINNLLNKVQMKKDLSCFYLGDMDRERKKFHVQNTLIYVLEVVLLKNVDKLWEITLTFEESFPMYVCGDYFRFRNAMLIFLRTVFVYTNFPKHSKFKIHCCLKEIDNSHDDGKYVLGFYFDMPKHEKQLQLFNLLFTHPIFNDISKLRSLFVHPSNRKENRQEFLNLCILLEILNCKRSFNDQDSNRLKLNFEMPFHIVTELETLLVNSRNEDINTSNNNLNGSQISMQRQGVNPKLLNLTFLRSMVKKIHFVWKPKQKKNNQAIHPAPIYNSMKNSKEIMRENSNSNAPPPVPNLNLPNPSYTDIKKLEDTKDQNIDDKTKKPDSPLNKATTEDNSALPRRSFKRRESKQLYTPIKAPLISKPDFEEIKSECSDNDQPNMIPLDHRKSHFSIMPSEELNNSSNLNYSLSKYNSAHKASPSISKTKGMENLEIFPMVLSYKLNELKNEKTKVLKKMLMKDALILLKQQVLNQQKKTALIFKSEMCIRKIPGEFIFMSNGGNIEELKDFKLHTFSSILELKKYDYGAYRVDIFKKCKELDPIDENSLDFFRKIDELGLPVLSKETKKMFLNLFSPTQQRNFALLPRPGNEDKNDKKRSISFVRQNYSSIPFSKIFQVKEPFLNPPEKSESKEFTQKEKELFIIPYLATISKNELTSAILTRLETRLSAWNRTGSKQPSMGLLRMKKIKRHLKFSIFVNDDNLNSFQEFQKLQYNSQLQVHYGQNFINSLDVFRDFLENGYNYDLIFIDLKGKTMNGLELMKNIRGIEKLTNAFASKIVGILGKDEELEGADTKGIDRFICRPIDETIIKNIINNFSSKPIL